MKKTFAAIGLAFALVWTAPFSNALSKDKQEEPTVRTVQGTVTDASGKPVAAAVVQLKNTKTLEIRSFIAKDDGSYVFHGLNRNVDYELKAEGQGASSGVRTLSAFDSRTAAVINLKLSK